MEDKYGIISLTGGIRSRSTWNGDYDQADIGMRDETSNTNGGRRDNAKEWNVVSLVSECSPIPQ